MTKEEVKKVLMVLEVTFSNFTVDNPERMVDAWHLFLNDYPADEILLALKTYITTQGSAYAPSVSELIAMTRKPVELSVPDEVGLWAAVRKAISRGLYDSQEEFNKLPEIAQKIVRRPEQLYEWAQMESSDIDTVVRSNFRRSYESITRKSAEIAALPKEIREQIESREQKGIEVKNGK